MALDVKEERHKDAPADGVPTAYTNVRWPGYSGWEDFVDAVGLRELFYEEDEGLMCEHPGTRPLLLAHLTAVEKAYETHAASTTQNNIARLEWLKYWMAWAITNCEKPVFYNS